MFGMNSLSVVIPTYNRGEVLLDTIAMLLDQIEPAEEIIIVDQTIYQAKDIVAAELKSLHDANKITWVRLDKPSIPHAMNVGLKLADSECVLFLDDDVSFNNICLLYTSPSPRDQRGARMPSSA